MCYGDAHFRRGASSRRCHMVDDPMKRARGEATVAWVDHLMIGALVEAAVAWVDDRMNRSFVEIALAVFGLCMNRTLREGSVQSLLEASNTLPACDEVRTQMLSNVSLDAYPLSKN